jgi:tetratricopeptide (TPR) repeat protein
MQTLSKLKSYDNKEWHFSFAYPSEWKILWENEPADSWIIPIAIAGQEQSGGLPCFSVNARRGEILQEKEQVLVFPSTPQEYIKQEQEELKRAFPGFQLISAEELLLDNKPSARLVYSYDGVKGRIQEECTTLFGVGVTFQFISEVPARDSAQFAPVFKGIFESLRIGRSSSENSIKIEGNTEISVSQQVTLSPQPLGAAAALKQWKTKGKTPWLVGGAILLLGLGGIGFWQFQVLSDHWAWEASQQVNTINGFEQYLQKHPQGKYVTQANQKLADLYLNQGNERLDKEDFQGAIADYNKAIELDPNFALAYSSRGYAYDNLKQWQKAIADYNQAIKLDPNSVAAYYNRGVFYGNLKQWQKAIADYNQAIKLDPNFALAYNNRGVVYYNLKQWQKALADYNQAIELDPNYALAYSSRGVVYSNLKQWQKALADYNQAIKLDPNLADAYIKRGWAYVNLNHWQKGIADLNKAIELDHDNALAYVIRGGIRAMQGDRREGRTDLRKAAQLYLQQGDQANYQATLNLLQQF